MVRQLVAFLSFLFAFLGTMVQGGEVPLRFYVSPVGRDEWSGKLKAPNSGCTDGPFATLQKAQSAVRDLKKRGLRQPVEVILRGGIYYLDQPLVFTPEDSGTANCPITYRSAPGEVAILSGGKRINGWKKIEDRLWMVEIPEARQGGWNFRVLRVGDRWAIRARYPNFDAQHPSTGGWLFAQWWGEPWERGAFNVGVSQLHPPGSRLYWRVRFPASGQYRVWVRYAHHNAPSGLQDMGGRTVLRVDEGPSVSLEHLPDTGGWGNYQWSWSATLSLTQGEHLLCWENRQGGGINLDAFLLTDDENWDPRKAIGPIEWWGGYESRPPAEGKHLVVIQAEACEKTEGEGITVPQPTPPGNKRILRFAPGTIPRWKSVQGAEIHLFPAWGWVNGIVQVDRIDYETCTIFLAGKGCEQDIRPGNRFFIANLREALDAPDEWYLDTRKGQLFYIPEDSRFPQLPVIAPRLDRLIVLQGDPARGAFVEHLHFKGLVFTDTDYSLEVPSYYTPADSALWMIGARKCSVSGCEFRWLGGYAIRLENRSHQIEITGNKIHHMGQGGVILLGDNSDQPHHNLIAGNFMQYLGLIYKHVAGVYVTTGSDNRIAHNTIWDTPRYAISLKSYDGSHSSHRNIVEYNDLRRTNLETNDTGAIETLGRDQQDTGNILRFNLILDVVGMGTTSEGRILTPYFTWGIYLDDYSSGTTVYGNVVARTVLGGICVHGGRNNHFENNILVEGIEHQIRLQPRDDFMKGNRFVRNIVYYSRPSSALVYSWDQRRDRFVEWDYNLYWLQGADLETLEVKNTPEGTFRQWREAGFDAHSLVADPRFVNPARDDYRLQPDSPAFRLGFREIPWEKIGTQYWLKRGRRRGI